MSRVSYWCFTLNNYTADELVHLHTVLDDRTLVKYAVFGKEVGENGTLHLQGFIILSNTQRLSYLRNVFSNRAHWEPTRSDASTNRTYCCKDGDYFEFGRLPTQGGNRTDLQTIVTTLTDLATEAGRALTSPEVARSQPVAYIRYPRLVRALTYHAPTVVLRVGEPREWQRNLEEELLGPADDRTITFYIDHTGNTGKSWFIDWFLTNHPSVTQLMTVGKAADVAFDIDPTKHIVLVDVSRGGMQYLSYRLLEQIKGRRVFSTKYGSTWKFYTEQTHVVVFTNEDPDMNALSVDRYVIRHL